MDTVFKEGFAKLYETEPFMMLHVHLFNTPYVTFITEAITTYEANVEQSETDFGITEQHNLKGLQFR
jgi:hypothetical protein